MVSRVTRVGNRPGGTRPALCESQDRPRGICQPRAEYGEMKLVYGELDRLPALFPCTGVLRHQALFRRPDGDLRPG
jgi:hypothetical protein